MSDKVLQTKDYTVSSDLPQVAWNATNHAWPADKCIHELFEQQVARTPDAVAVEEKGISLSYAQLNERANQLAHRLLKLDIKPNRLVGVLLERSIDVLVAIYGTLKAGGAYVPLDPAYPQERLDYMIETAKATVLITQSKLTSQISTERVTVLRLDGEETSLRTEPKTNPSVDVSPENLIYVIFTSGSTGRPKGAAVYHRGFTNLLHWFTTEFSITSDDRTLLVSSLSFDLTQKNLYACLITGGSLHIYPPGPYDVALMTQLVESRGITLLNCTPSAFYPLVEPASDETFRRLASLRAVFLGGESISIPRLRPWLTHPTCRAEIANTYGPTECTDICGAYRMNRGNRDAYPFVPLGRPVYNVQLAIVDPELKPCPIGVAGELLVGGAGVGAGYLNDPVLTDSKFIPNHLTDLVGPKIYRTGDQGRWLPDGVIEFLGRLDHQVKIRGFRIELHEIEAAFDAHPEVRETIVVVKEAAVAGADPRLVAYFTTQSGQPLPSDSLKAFAGSRLPEYMVPASLIHLDKFPLSPNGKVDRRALRELREPAVFTTARPLAAGTDLETKIRGVWMEILGRPDVDLDQNFFDLGGDSIQLARVHVSLLKILGRDFPITDLFAHTTIRTLAKHFHPSASPSGKINAIQDRARLQREAAAARRPSPR